MAPLSHFDDMAAGIASLPEDDPERAGARLHAATCPRCANALREAEQLMMLLDEAPPLEAPSPETLDRVARAVLAQMDAAPKFAVVAGEVRARRAWVVPVPALAAAWAVLLLLARSQATDTENWMVSAVVLLCALGLVALALRTGTVALVLALGASLGLSFGTGNSDGFELLHGVKCVVTELVAAAAPYAALFFTVMRGQAVSVRSCAAVAAAGALGGQAALHITCPELAHTPHLIATHVAGVVLAALLGTLGHRWFVRRAEA